MVKERNPNIEMLEVVVACLGPLIDDVVFLGGCAAGLLITDVAAPPVRATRDVDVITEACPGGKAGHRQFLDDNLNR